MKPDFWKAGVILRDRKNQKQDSKIIWKMTSIALNDRTLTGTTGT